MTRIYSLEGNIGSGKSTLIDLLQNSKALNSKFLNNIVYLPEPVDIWSTIKDDAGITILEKFYKDQNKYAFSFQMMAYISRISQLRQAIRDNPYSILITERSVYTDKNVFAQMLYDNNKIEKVNYNIYLRWFEEFTLDLPLSGIIYIKTSPEICNKRILERNRKGEDNIPLDYSIQCHKYHEAWLNKTQRPVLVLDGDSSHKTRISNKWLDEIKIFVHPEASPKIQSINNDWKNKAFC